MALPTSKFLVRVAEFVQNEFHRRKEHPARKALDEKIAHVDRQVAMIPEESHIENDDAPQIEPPLQAQAVEVITADIRSLAFPTDRSWFAVGADFEERALAKIAEDGVFDGNDETEIQRNLNDLIHASMATVHEMYDMRGAWDALNAEATSYGTFVGRVRLVRPDIVYNQYRGPGHEIPVLVPYSVKNTYLDTSSQAMAREGHIVAPSTVRRFSQGIEDIRQAAKAGVKDDIYKGGWVRTQVSKLKNEPGDRAKTILEYEGDLILDDDYVENVIVGVCDGRVIRYREKPVGVNDLITQHYHVEGISAYGTSPILKGVPLQRAIGEILRRALQVAIKNAHPPCRYSPSDPNFVGTNGPLLTAGAMNAAISDPTFWQFGDLNGLQTFYFGLLKQYEELTGVSAPRLGGTTKSHQTAFAVDQEITRGQARTVDYVRSLMKGAMNTFLNVEYRILRETMPAMKIYSEKLNGWFPMKRAYLPELVNFQVHGAGGPLEEREKQVRRAQALQLFIQLEPMARQLRATPGDIDQIRKDILIEAGLTDVERYFGQEQAVPEGTPQLQAVPGVA